MTRLARTLELLTLAVLMVAIVLSAFYLANHLGEYDTVRGLVEKYGLFGMIAVAFIGGLNVVVPVHAATFTPIFATYYSMYTIITCLVLGTMLADLLAYQIGMWGKRSTRAHFPRFHDRLITFTENHHKLILPGVFLYSAFIPFPNETILIPLGLAGYRYWTFVVPLILGVTVNQMMYSFGFIHIFDTFF